MSFNMQHIKRKYLVYRNKNFDVPDEVIESTLELEPEVLVRLRHDDTIDRVDLEIHQIFTWSNYLAFLPVADKLCNVVSEKR